MHYQLFTLLIISTIIFSNCSTKKSLLPDKKEVTTAPINSSQKSSIRKKKKLKNTQEVFKVVERMPRFPGCEGMAGTEAEKKKCSDQKMLEFIYKNLQYPAEAKKKKIEGVVVVQFIVEPNGYVSNPEILKDIGEGCGEEAIRLINLMSKKNIRWTPQPSRSQAKRVQFVLPIRFELPLPKD